MVLNILEDKLYQALKICYALILLVKDVCKRSRQSSIKSLNEKSFAFHADLSYLFFFLKPLYGLFLKHFPTCVCLQQHTCTNNITNTMNDIKEKLFYSVYYFLNCVLFSHR